MSTVVDISDTVAGTLVDAANWLMRPATRVPILPEIAAGDPSFPMGAAVEEATDPDAFRDWRPVSHLEIGLDTLAVAGDAGAAGRLVADGAETGGAAVSFTSLSALRRYLGPAGEGNQWHHIVEQTPGNLQRFGPEAIHSTDNVVRVPASIHVGRKSISAYYSGPDYFTNGQTVRRWLSTQSFEAQRRFGIRTLKRYINGSR